MGWQRRLESFRDRLADDPSGVQEEITRELVYHPNVVTSPSARVCFYGILIACCRNMGKPDDGLRLLDLGRRLGGSAGAQADLLAHGASLHIQRGDAVAAQDCAEKALELLQRELAKPAGKHPRSRKRRRDLIKAKAVCVVLRGEITVHLEVGSLKDAMADALDVLTLTSHRSTLRVRMAAVTLLCNLLVRYGTFDDVKEALRLLHQADTGLAKQRFERSHPYRVRIRWGKALALARLGVVDRAEAILVKVVEDLMKTGAWQVASDAVDALVWIVRDRAGQPGRAQYLKRRYVARFEE